MELIGERVLLRPWKPEDAEALCRLASDPEVAGRAGFPIHRSADDSLRVIRDVFSAPECYAIVLPETSAVIGCIQVFDAMGRSVYDSDALELGFWLGRQHWGSGLMPEAVALLCGRCLRHDARPFSCTRVYGRVKPDNVSSRRVFEKCGFVTCAEDQKWVTYVADLPVARIGDATYGSLQEALDAGGEITLLRDVGSDAEPVATGLLVGKDVTLDLAGFAIVGRADGADVRFRLFRLDHDANLTIVGTGSVRVYGGEGAANGGILFAGCGRVSILGEVDCYAENYLYLREDLTCLSIEAQSGRFKTGACSWRSLSRDYNWIDYDNHHYEWDVEGWQIVVPGAARISMNIEEMKDLFRGDVLAMLAELVETNQWGDWDFSITLETDSASAPVSRICLWRSTDYSNDTEGLIGEQEDISAASFLELISYLAERLLDDAPPTRATYDRLYAQLVAKTCPSALLRSTGTSILE